jgi:hypothetical protein
MFTNCLQRQSPFYMIVPTKLGIQKCIKPLLHLHQFPSKMNLNHISKDVNIFFILSRVVAMMHITFWLPLVINPLPIVTFDLLLQLSIGSWILASLIYLNYEKIDIWKNWTSIYIFFSLPFTSLNYGFFLSSRLARIKSIL